MKLLVDEILPKYSIISVNNTEYSRHPSKETLERLNSINSQIYRTDEKGTIWITSDGNKIELTFLDTNLNGKKDNKISMILLEDRYYSLIFYCKVLPSSSTIL